MLGSRRGTTLVEILVTMVVLLIGIMTVVQMFPSGFMVVRAAESTTIATKLAQAELERWKATSINLPTGIVPIRDIGTIDQAGTVINNQYPGPPFKAIYEDPNGEIVGPNGVKYSRGNVLNIRQIIGETTRIPVGSYFQTAVGSLYGGRYALAFGPIDVRRGTRGELVGLAIKSGDLRRRGGRQEYYPPDLRLGEYAIDYGDGSARFYVAFPRDPATPNRLYYISYSYWATNQGTTKDELISVLDQEVGVPGDQGDWVAVDVTPLAGYDFVDVESGTDSCARGFAEVEVGNWSLEDPYEFALADNILGVVAFNPMGRGMYEYTAQGVKPIEARISYRILDPRIIREDKVVPDLETGATKIPVKLALRFILNNGDATDNPNELVYKGMAPAAGLTQPLIVIDLATGMRIDLRGFDPDDPTDDVEVDYQAGVVEIPVRSWLLKWDEGTGQEEAVGGPVELEGRNLRFFYRADGDWTIQCQKAYALYARESGTSELDYCHFKVGDPAANPSRLYFAPCEAEKTVAVDYTYIKDSVEYKIVGESHRVSEFSDATNLYFIDLNVPPGGTLRRVYAVVGTSFRVRVIWRDGRAWRHVDLDTNLTRGQ